MSSIFFFLKKITLFHLLIFNFFFLFFFFLFGSPLICLLALPPTFSMGFVSVFFPLLKKKGGKKKVWNLYCLFFFSKKKLRQKFTNFSNFSYGVVFLFSSKEKRNFSCELLNIILLKKKLKTTNM